MQHVNDDMDDVFKKAGEAYPLRTGMPDWDKVQQALHAQKEPEPTRKKNNNRYLWLLCLLPLFICNRYAGNNNGPDVNLDSLTTNNVSNTNKTTAQVPAAVRPNKTIPAPKPLSPTKHPSAPNKKEPLYQKYLSEKHPPSGLAKTANPTGLPQANDPFEALTETGILRTRAGQNKAATALKSKQRITAAVSGTFYETFSTLGSLQTDFLPDSIRNAIAAGLSPMPKKSIASASKSTLLYTKGFYAGIMGSADLTSVRLQKTAGVGWQYGILAGYAFHKKWSVEAGLFASRKYYDTKGRYFDRSRTYLPPNSEITAVSGSCTMLEFPLAIKYNLPARKRSQYFATAGISSYIMKKEDYAYTYYYRNSGTYAVYDKYYRNASTNLFSVLQLSGGYAHSLGRSTSVRVEPYLKLPLAGLGYGKLHFTSFGLSAGVVKSFRRR